MGGTGKGCVQDGFKSLPYGTVQIYMPFTEIGDARKRPVLAEKS